MQIWKPIESGACAAVLFMIRFMNRMSVLARHQYVAILTFLALNCAVGAYGAEPESSNVAPSALHRAICQGEREVWQRLLREGADVTMRDESGNTPLHMAALHGNADCVRELLDCGADTNAANDRDATPLFYGVASEDVVRRLLEHGANPNAVSKFGMTPLLCAVKRGHSYDIARLLIDAGADVNVGLNGFWQGGPLFTAIGSGDPRTVELLIARGADLDVQGNSISPLQQAAAFGDLRTVKRLVEAGVDLNYSYEAMDSPGTALTWAMWAANPKITAYLIDQGADLHRTPNTGSKTPPMVWAGFGQSGDSTIARKMVAQGLDVNAANDAGETALFYALKAGPDTELVRYLKSVGAQSPHDSASKKSIPSRAVPERGVARDELVRESSQRAIDLMQHSSEAFLQRRNDKCVSCHHQLLPSLAYAMGRERGLHVDNLALGHQLADQVDNKSENIAKALQLLDFSFGWPRRLVSLDALRYTPDELTAAMARFVRETQSHDGTWLDFGRPPLGESRWAEVAWAVRAMKLFPRAGEEKATQQSVGRAMQWLRRETPATNNERSSRLLGLGWGGESRNELQPHVQPLLGEQHADGGWSQLPTLESDAWATGKTLFALYEVGGVSTDDPAYQRGVEYLLRTQFEDGSWWVRNRTWPFQPHFDSQFPHGKDQWISIAGTAWATMALLAALEPVRSNDSFPTGQELIAQWKAAEAAKLAREEAAEKPAVTTVNFQRDIRPLLQRSCMTCHDGEAPEGDFSMASRDLLLKGGQSSLPAIVPGDGDNSPMVRFASDQVEDLEMPPLDERDTFPALTQKEIELLRTWIDQGAPWKKPQ